MTESKTEPINRYEKPEDLVRRVQKMQRLELNRKSNQEWLASSERGNAREPASIRSKFEKMIERLDRAIRVGQQG